MDGVSMLDRDSNQFDRYYEIVRSEIIQIAVSTSGLKEFDDLLGKLLDHNVTDGKKMRGSLVVSSFRHFAKPDMLTDQNIELAYILGWCVEILQGYILIMDDMLDGSQVRRGRPCWYRLPEVGVRAINDSVMLEHLVFALIDRRLSNHPLFTQFYQLFHMVSLYTFTGQTIDALSSLPGGRPDFSKFTDDRYSKLINCKTAYYTCYLPIRLGMLLANIDDPQMDAEFRPLLVKIGHFFQTQDDYLDCYGDREMIGKLSTDIEEGKCTWLIVEALKLANEQQRHLLMEHYGRQEKDSVAIVKKIYEELELNRRYLDYQTAAYTELNDMIHSTCKKIGISPDLISALLKKLYKSRK